MKQNVGSTDKIVRLLIAVGLVALFFTGTLTGTLGIVGLVAAGVLTLTSIVGTCPLYSILGITTCPIKNRG